MSDLSKVASGGVLVPSAGDYNAFIDAALAHKRRQANMGFNGEPLDTKPGILWVRNNSGQDITTIGAVLGLDGLEFTPDGKLATAIVFKGITPDKAKHRGRFCILTGPVAAGKIVEAYLGAVALVRLFVPLEEGADRALLAEVDDGSPRLRPAGYGSAQILYRETTGYGEMWAVVRMGQSPATFPVKLAQVGGGQGSSAAAATWTYDAKDSYTDEMLTTTPVDPAMSPHKFKRPPIGQMIKATYGLARFDKDGKIVLNWINEIPDQESC